MTTPPTADAIFDYEGFESRLDEHARAYRAAEPFPHAVLDDFLVPAAARRALDDFPSLADGEWLHHVHVNERKFGRPDRASYGPHVGAAVDELNSPRFVALLERLTGIRGLFADSSFQGGGLHQSARGGFLNIHADFTVHPRHRDWRRRVNVLVYLNEDWPDAYGGHLELWDRDVTACARRVAPTFNRAVIFNTDRDSFHGHPEPLTCPDDRTRKSIALYYFTRDDARVFTRSTEYRARPGDGPRRALIYADKMALRLYDAVKRRVGFDDRLVSRVLAALDRLRPR